MRWRGGDAAGLGKRAGAQGAEEGAPEFDHCVVGHPGVEWHPAFEGDPQEGEGKPCGGGPNGCHEGSDCLALLNPAGQRACRCVRLDRLG